MSHPIYKNELILDHGFKYIKSMIVKLLEENTGETLWLRHELSGIYTTF